MGWFTWLVGKPINSKELLRRNQRLVNKAIRNIERERYILEKQEQKQIVEIKRVAQKNQPDVVRALANDLVRTRNHIKKLIKMKANLQGVALQLTTLEAQQSIMQAVHHATLVLRGLNRHKLPLRQRQP
ncbi:unnamed protein product [Orchesella dallaii]|uniref:Charged multivesicular body protein 2a n=1 Tax=Orchesella dallaii TaxID=48710 RepID=A0ABP1Q3A1_9HEXA